MPMWKVGHCTCSSELHHQEVLCVLPEPWEWPALAVCFRWKRNIPAYRKQEQLNSTLPTDWSPGRVRVSRVELVSVSTRERVVLQTELLLHAVMKSTNTLALLRAMWSDGQMLRSAMATEDMAKENLK